MNRLEKFLALIGLSSERFEKMSEAEQANLTQISETHASLEQERDTAVSTLEAAQTQITELTNSLSTAQEENESLWLKLKNSQTAIEEANASLQAKDLEVTVLTDLCASLNTKLAAKPSADGTVIVTESSEGQRVPGKPSSQEGDKYLTSADRELAEFHSKFSKK